jgi:hypothetical protein
MIDTPWIPTEKPLFMVRICINKRLNTDRLPSCAGRGSRGLADLIERRLLDEGLPASIVRGPCMNNCLEGPNLKVEGGAFISLQNDLSDAAFENIIVEIRREVERRKALTPAP